MAASDAVRILLTGATGQLGRELTRELAPLGRVVALGRTDVDLAQPDALRASIRAIAPLVIVNAAAYTAVDRAEEDSDACHAVNAEAPGIMAEEARALGAALIHYSTDYVFPGDAALPYREEDVTGPVNAYGASKLAGERAVAAADCGAIVLRTSWVFGAYGHNFLRTILRLARERDEMRVVDDQTGAPTWSRMIASATAQLLASTGAARHGAAAFDGRHGVYHIAAGGQTTWYHFARAILARDPLRNEQRVQEVYPIASAEYPTPARRPRWSVLDCSKLHATFRLRLPDWDAQLAMALS